MDKSTLRRTLAALRTWLQFRFDQEDMPGLALAVTHKGKLVFNECFGYADIEKHRKLQPGHLFRIASHSKTFTATAVMKLQEQGALRLDDKVMDYLPWLRDHSDKRWRNITIRQLLCHGAGMVRDGLDSDFWQLERPFPDTETFKKAVLAANLVIENNVKLKYSNFGYGLLGLVVEAASGQTYDAYITERLLAPLKLPDIYPEISDSTAARHVTGYAEHVAKEDRLPIAHIETGALAPATGFCASPGDLSRFFAALMLDSGKLLTNESKKEMRRMHFPIKDASGDIHGDYGLGVSSKVLQNRTMYGHGGSFPGHRTQTLVDPQTELSVTVATNVINGPVTDILEGAFHLIECIREHPPAHKSVRQLEGVYANLWNITWILGSGTDMFASYPGRRPFKLSEKLLRIDATNFRVAQADSIDAEGEAVVFEVKNGKVRTITYNGATMWPLDVWYKKQRQRRTVSLPAQSKVKN